MDVLSAMIRNGISLARSVELTAQWDRILAIGPLHPVTIGDLDMVRGVGLGEFYRVVSDVHRRFSDFVHAVVVHRRNEAVRGWRIWLRESFDSSERWLRPDLMPPAPFLQCEPHILRLVVLEFFLILPGLMRNSERPGFPTFVALGKGRPALRNSMWRLRVGFLYCLCLSCLD